MKRTTPSILKKAKPVESLDESLAPKPYGPRQTSTTSSVSSSCFSGSPRPEKRVMLGTLPDVTTQTPGEQSYIPRFFYDTGFIETQFVQFIDDTIKHLNAYTPLSSELTKLRDKAIAMKQSLLHEKLVFERFLEEMPDGDAIL